jgi:uncharacterized protein (TIGR04552 family)
VSRLTRQLPPVASVLRREELTVEDLEAVRILLRGGSVIDWHRLDFQGHPEVDRFLRVNEFDPDSDSDMARLEDLRADAIDYLARNYSFRIPDDIASAIQARDLFLMASRSGRRQTWACVVLKVMHIIHHLRGREAAIRLPVSDERLFQAVELKVMQVVEELRAAGYPIYEFQWSRKPLDSLVTKLLAKRSTLAANIYDKLRFRLIVRERADLLPMLAVLTRRLIPFNYVIPGESINHLVSLRDEINLNPRLRALEPALQFDTSLERQQERAAAGPLNEFSGKQYKIINFVADLPVRMASVIDDPQDVQGHVLFILTEFQLADKETAIHNEQGDSSHEEYKARQRRRVRKRLMRGSRKSQSTDSAQLVDAEDD